MGSNADRTVVIEADCWLTGIFGHDVFRVTVAGDASPDSVMVTMTESMENRSSGAPAFYYAKVPTERVEHSRALTSAGFHIVDTSVTFDRTPAAMPDDGAGNPVRIRDVRQEDREEVLEIAGTCFIYSRFHLDPNVPGVVADGIKREWINSYLLGRRGEPLIVADVQGRPAGFLAMMATSMNGQKVRVIDLVGVDRAKQGCGVGKSLVEFFIHDSMGRFDRLMVGTQAANIPSVRLYEGCGFRLARSAYVLHAHVADGKVKR